MFYTDEPSVAILKGAEIISGKRAINHAAWALGKETKRGFHVRRIVWGRVLAREEKRPDETIRKAMIVIRLENRNDMRCKKCGAVEKEHEVM